MLLAGILIPAAWGVGQDPPAQPQTPPAPADKASEQDKKPQGMWPHHRAGGRWGRGDANGPTGSVGGPDGPLPGDKSASRFAKGRRGGFPPMFDALANMSPEERNQALESDPKFSRLPPERQAQIRQNLERYSAMTPEQRQLMRDRFDIVNSMPPQNRDRIREVFPRWRQLPADRQQAMREEFHSLARMSAADREKRFADPEFQKSFAPREQQLLKDLAGSLR